MMRLAYLVTNRVENLPSLMWDSLDRQLLIPLLDSARIDTTMGWISLTAVHSHSMQAAFEVLNAACQVTDFLSM